MAIRTMSAAVQGLLNPGGDYNEGDDLDPFIETANAIVDGIVTCAAALGVTLSSSRLELIERWLSAHCYVMSNQADSRAKSEKGETYFQGQTGLYLEGSKYAQTAIILDTSGCLANLNVVAESSEEAPLVGIEWMGKVPSEQIPYYLRD